MRIHWALGLFLAFAIPIRAQQAKDTPFVPLEVLSAKTIAVAVDWPAANWREKASVQADGENFLRGWKRYRVVRLSEGPDLIALVVVEPVGRTGGFWKRLAYALSLGAQAYALSAQNYEQCYGQAVGNQIDLTCTGYSPALTLAAAPPPPPPNYVLGGSILVFDGTFLRTRAPVPEPLMVAEADNHGNAPLIGAGKRMRRMIEENEKLQAGRMETINALLAKVHELSVASGLAPSEEPKCASRISTRIGADKNMLGHIERGDFQDVEGLFSQLCQQKP
jgi:hypothetical protein